MASQPKSSIKEVQRVQFCSVYDQQRVQVSSLQPQQNFDAIANSTINEITSYLDKWATYTNNVVGSAIEMMDQELTKKAGDLEKMIKEALEKANYLPDTIINFLKESFKKFQQIIIDAAEFSKSKVIYFAQKMSLFFEKTFQQLKQIFINNVLAAYMKASIEGKEKIANFIYATLTKFIGFITVIKSKLGSLESAISKLFSNITFFGKIKAQINLISDFLGTLVSKVSIFTSKSIGAIGKVIGELAIVFDLIIKLGKTLFSAFDPNTNFSETGLDSFWYNLSALIVTVLIFLIGLALAKVGFLIAGYVLLAAGIGLAIYEIYSGVDLLALSLSEPIRNLWIKIKELYEEIKYKISTLPEAIVREIYGIYGVPWF
jgi:hypothetical protein